MKFITLLVTLLFCVTTFAKGDWRSIENFENSKAYWSQAQCEKHTGKDCSRCKDVRKCEAGQVDDLAKPRYKKADSGSCVSADDCREKLQNLDCLAHADDAFGVISADFSEIYCAIPDGYHKKPGLVIDAAKAAQADAADNEKAQEQAQKRAKRQTRLADIASCAKAASLSTAHLQSCVRSLAREVARQRLKASDM